MASQSILHEANSNAGAIQAVTAVLLLAITAWYVALTRRIATSAVEAQRPYVFLEFAASVGLLQLIIGNSGVRAAHGVTFAVTSPEVLEEEIQKIPAISGGIPYLPPGARYRYEILVSPERLFNGEDSVTLEVGIKYTEGRIRYEEPRYKISFHAFEGILFSSFTDPGDVIGGGVREIARELRRSRPVATPLMVRGPQQICPVCAERVARGASKCPHCLEWIGSLPESPSTRPHHDGFKAWLGSAPIGGRRSRRRKD